MRNKKYFIFVARLAPENASIFVETRGGIRFPRVRARARTTARHREIPYGRNKHNRIRYAAGRGRPALPTASSALKPNVRVVISSVSREIPCIRNENKRTRTLACGGSPPRPQWLYRFKAIPPRARRGGAKHRKNNPRVTVFSQSGEVAMLQAGRWQRRGNLPEGKCRKRTRASQLARGGSPPSVANRAGE